MTDALPTADPLGRVFKQQRLVEPLDEALVTSDVESALFGRARPVVIGRYRLETRVGQGGGGIVYRGFDPQLQRPVAIKLFRSQGDATEVARLRQEGRALAKLRHPNVVEVYDVLDAGRGVAMVMEWIEGVALNRWLSQTRPAPPTALAAFIAAGRGLAAVHAAGWVHRDFKPSNVMVAEDGTTKLVDFGLALHLRSRPSTPDSPIDDDSGDDSGDLDQPRLTRSGAIPGTPAYMAPEARAGAGQDAACDQYALCASLYEALFHTLPPDVPQPVVDARPGLGRQTRRALARGLHRDPQRRFGSVDALLDALHPRPRRRWMVAASVAAIAVATVVWATQPSGPCVDGAPGLQSPWPMVRADRIERRSDTDGRAIERLDDALNTYGTRFETAATLTCAPDRQATDTPARLSCLDARRTELHSFVEMLAEADDTAFNAAAAAAGRLTSPERCADPQLSSIDAWMPADAQSPLLVQRLRRKLSDAQAQILAARFDRAIPLLQEVVTEATEAGFPPIAVAARVSLGQGLIHQGNVAEGTAELTALYEQAVAEGFDEQAAHVASGLVFAIGYMLGDYDAALPWARQAEALLERLGDNELEQATLDAHLGSVEALAGHYDTAEHHHRNAERIRRAHATTAGAALGSTLSNLGNLMLLQKRLDESQTFHAEALQLRRQHLGDGHPDIAVSMCSLAAISMSRAQWDDARQRLETAVKIWHDAVGPDHRDLIHPLHNLAVVASAQGRLDDAQRHVRHALSIAQQHYDADDGRIAMIQMQLGRVLARQERFDDALGAFFAAELIVGDSADDENSDAALLRFNIGGAYFRMQRYEETLRYTELALAHWRVHGDDPNDDAAVAQLRCAASEVELQRFGAARVRLDALLATPMPTPTAGIGLDPGAILDRATAEFLNARALEGEHGRTRTAVQWARAAQDRLSAVEGQDAQTLRQSVQSWLQPTP